VPGVRVRFLENVLVNGSTEAEKPFIVIESRLSSLKLPVIEIFGEVRLVREGRIVLYLNEASNTGQFIFSSPKPLQLDGLSIKVEKNSIPFIADWDSDGGKDLLIGEDGKYLHLYLNSVVNGEPDLMGGEEVDREEHVQILEKDLAIPYFIGMNMLQLNL